MWQLVPHPEEEEGSGLRRKRASSPPPCSLSVYRCSRLSDGDSWARQHGSREAAQQGLREGVGGGSRPSEEEESSQRDDSKGVGAR